MNNLAFQIYGTKKATPFQSVWKTDTTSTGGGEQAARGASAPVPSDWALGPGGGTNLFTAGYTHNASGSNPLQFGMTMTAGQSWRIICTFSAGSTGEVIINFGDAPSVTVSTNNLSTTINLTTTTTLPANFRITPVNFVGNVKLSILQSSSAANQIQLPINGIPVGKSIWIDWGDNSYTNANNGNIIANRIHTYSTPGEYTVRILGDNFNFGFGYLTINDKLKIKSISSWGKLKIGGSSFLDCSNVTMSGITDVPDLTGVSNINLLVSGCTNITTIGRINEWNTSSIINMGSVFSNCTNFNSDISNWNVSNVTYFLNMFNNCSKFNNGYAPGVYNQLPWTINTSVDVNIQGMFQNAASFNANLGNGVTPWNFSKVTNMVNMFNGASKFNNGFASGNGIGNQLPWNTSACTSMSNMFLNATAFNSNLGTGTTPWDVSKVTTFQGMFNVASKFNNGDDSAPINNWNIGGSVTGTITLESMFSSASAFNRDISGWDVSKVNTLSGIFANAINFENGLNTNINPVTLRTGLDGWNIVVTGNMYGVFLGASKFNRPLSNWNTTSVTWMLSMFQNAVLFNQDISSWNVGNVTNMGSMFAGAIQFNKDISSWNVGKVTIFTGTFSGATAFNNGGNSVTNPITSRTGINGWNIGATALSVVTNQMFQNTNFNRYIGDWDVSKVTAMGNMFLSNVSFNQDLSKWNVGSVTSMEAMFYNADAFTNGSNTNTNPVTGLTGINGWNINTSPAASVTMLNMFATNNAFNQPIGSWNVSRVTNMTDMFNSTTAFNQSLSNWERVSSPDTSTLANVTTMQRMFASASAFNNGELPGVASTLAWNTIGVGDMGQMFDTATAFNCDIGGFNVSNCANFGFMFRGANTGTVSRFNNGGSSSIGSWILKSTGSINMWFMFGRATAFNQPIGAWNTSRVTSMQTMFSQATSFNQNIGSWNVSLVSNFSGFMENKTFNDFSSANLDAIYNGWIVNGVKPNTSSPLSTNISFGTAKYSQAGKLGRDTLLASPNNWRITDGGNETVLALDAGNPLSYPGTGTLWTDLSGNNNNGTLVNGPTFDSANGGSIVFDGNDDYVNCGNASNLQITVGTISAWVKTTTPGSDYRGIIVKQFSWGLYVQDGVLTTFDFGNSANRSTGINISDGTWKNITMTFTETVGTPSNNAIVYLNGNPVLTTTIKYVNNTINVELGRGGSSGIGASQLLNGSISEAKIYNRVLSSTEILANFNATKGRYGL